jgi:hypothetical protein
MTTWQMRGRSGVARVGGQAWIAHPGHGRVVSEAAGEFSGVALPLLQSHSQGAHAAQCEECLQCARCGPAQFPAAAELLSEFRAIGDRKTKEQVGVSAEELGCAMHGDVCSQGERALEQRGGEGVVDRHKSAAGIGRGTQRR